MKTKYIIYFLLGLIGLDYLNSKRTGNRMKTMDLIDSLPLGNKSPDGISQGSGGSFVSSDISSQRKYILMNVAKGVIQALKGMGVPNRHQFKDMMIQIQSDAEYAYTASLFPELGEREGMEKFINKQILLGKDVKNAVNAVYAERGMLTRLKV